MSPAYSAQLVQATDPNRLAELARRIDLHCPLVLDPRFFLASLPKGWLPRIVLVTESEQPIGLLYTREKMITGWPSGVFYGDGTLGNLVLAGAGKGGPVLGVAVQKLLDALHVRAVRCLVPPGGDEERIIRKAVTGRNLYLSQTPEVLNHSRLRLARTYEEFLKNLGSRTRRNFRYYRRQAEASGYRYVDRLSTAEMAEAARFLRNKSRLKSPRSAVERICTWLSAVDRPFACG